MELHIANHRLQAWWNRGELIEFGRFRHRVFVMDAGEEHASASETLLLLHGFPESSYSYAGALPGLLQCFKRVVLFDMLGYGFSDKPQPEQYAYSLVDQADVALSVWRQLEICGGHILGHDMGDSVLTELLARLNDNRPDWFGEGFQSVTLTNGGMVLSEAKLRIGQKLLLSSAGRLLSRGLSWYPVLKQQIISAHGNTSLTDEQIRDIHDAITFRSWPGLTFQLIGYIRERRRFERSRWLPAIEQTQVPIHISWASDDCVAPVGIANYLKDRVCPHAVLSVTRGLGHFCQIQDPALWQQPLVKFWMSIL